MKKHLGFSLVLIVSLLFGSMETVAQNSEVVLTNDDIVEMVKNSIPNSIIVAKINHSKTLFNTSTDGIKKLKEAGISDEVIIVMIESAGAKFENRNEIQDVVYELKDATEKKRIFVNSTDEKSLLEIVQVLKKNDFTVVSDVARAELVLKFEYSINEMNIGFSPGIRGGIYMGQTSKQQNGKFMIFLLKDGKEHLVFIRERRPSTIGKLLHKQAKDFTESFVKEVRQTESGKPK